VGSETIILNDDEDLLESSIRRGGAPVQVLTVGKISQLSIMREDEESELSRSNQLTVVTGVNQ
jgi:predicted nuclease of predicted toxin-antitoxin system